MFLIFLAIVCFSQTISTLDNTPSNKSPHSWSFITCIFGEYKPLTQKEIVNIQEKNKQRRIEIEYLQKRIARLQEDSSDDESSVKQKKD